MVEVKFGKKWDEHDDKELVRLYSDNTKDIVDIAKHLRRTPISIACRLVKNSIINYELEARGYHGYKSTDYYKECVEKKNMLKTEEKPKKEKERTNKNNNENYLVTINRNDYFELKYDVDIMKKDIKEIKNTLNELVEMMNAVYEFEDA
jgi:hypothetical protein